jgi:hypothetical protein
MTVRQLKSGAGVLMVGMAALLVGLGTQARATSSSGKPPLPPPARSVPRGLAPGLARAHGGQIRVAILPARQPMMAAAATTRIQRRLANVPGAAAMAGARRSPGRLTTREVASADRASQRRARTIQSLRSSLAATRTELVPLARAVRNAGGRVLERSLSPATIIARADPDSLKALLRRADVVVGRA